MFRNVVLYPTFKLYVHNMRKKIYTIIDIANGSKLSHLYDILMFLVIIVSIVPLAFREEKELYAIIDRVAASVFIIDYLLRWLTADFRWPHLAKWKAFLIYPFSTMAIIDLLSILPSFAICNRALKLFRLTRLVKILRVFKLVRYSRNIQLLFRVLRKERGILMAVCIIAITYIFVTALIMFNVEESVMFQDFFDALYWATTTLTTVGYGDICPQTDLGRVISMISALMGVAVIALPSGVITASYLEELREEKNRNKNETQAQI